ncbi:hypothetical protein SAMN06265222_11740 [Neorhodopirellula lusitana]|uniref:Uncharacterized protein n=1 Tax=Neorhodopirellula lusitana TaxID=445327 RepID=A0ABY1QK13_9BACT|nr:hypothetical protein [Neorhodopirellula lusitana]SMP73892.1 hypothetical protein SAMN06265222_11740 [Neorhodopirellula lusitana]
MFGFKTRSMLIAGAVTLAIVATMPEKADAAWGYGYGYGYRAPVARAYRPAYVARPVYAPRPVAYAYRAPVRVYRPAVAYVAPVPRRVYRPVVPVAPVAVTPYYSGYRGYGGVSVNIGYGVAPVGYIGY